MTGLLVIALAFVWILFGRRREEPADVTPRDSLALSDKYQAKWLFSYNEKTAYRALKEVCDQNGLYLMAKVRLLDLVEPRKGVPIIYFNKIRSKHVDFVICDQKLVARCVVELDDTSHKREDRAERDKFVDGVLKAVGYEIFHTEGITEGLVDSLLKYFGVRKETGGTE